MIRTYSSALFLLGAIIASSIILYHTSDRVTALNRQMSAISSQINKEQKSIHILKAEWVYLSNPSRIETEAQKHLGLQPTSTRRITSLPNMSALLASRDGVLVASKKTIDENKSAVVLAATPRARRDNVIAALNDGRINDHVVLQHAPSVRTSPDKIGALINSLSMRP